jgi:hypothetical protein
VSTTSPNAEQLERLRRLHDVFGDLEQIVLQCVEEDKVTDNDSRQYAKLITEAQMLYGQIAHLIPKAILHHPASGRQWDAFQEVLATRSISALLDYTGLRLWRESFDAAQSKLGQSIGRAIELERQGRLGLGPEVMERYARLMTALESVRKVIGPVIRLATSPFKRLESIVQRLEKWPPFRLLILLGGVFAGIVVTILFLSFAL